MDEGAMDDRELARAMARLIDEALVVGLVPYSVSTRYDRTRGEYEIYALCLDGGEQAGAPVDGLVACGPGRLAQRYAILLPSGTAEWFADIVDAPPAAEATP